MVLHFSCEPLQTNIGLKGGKAYFITDFFELVLKVNVLDHSNIKQRLTGFELNYSRNKDINPWKQRQQPFLKVKSKFWTRPNPMYERG